MDKDRVVELAVSMVCARIRRDALSCSSETLLCEYVRAIISADKMAEQELKRRYNENP